MSSFKLEKEMTPIVRKWLEDEGYIVRAEMVSANNCDLIGCSFNPDNVRKRIELKQATALTWRDFDPVEEDPNSLLGFKSVDRVVREWMPLYENIIAVELKLSRISEVISQARTHMHYTHGSYIAMPIRTARRAVDRTLGVGVLGVRKSSVEILKYAVRCRPKNEWFSHRIVEAFWRFERKQVMESLRVRSMPK